MDRRLLTPGVVAAVVAAPALVVFTLVGAPSAQAASPCVGTAGTDYNGDGRTDAVVADPLATVGGQAGAGQVVVLYGDGDGLVGEGARGVLSQGSGAVGGVAEAGDHFGAAVVSADLDCDGYTDLVAGTPQEDINAQADSGYVQVIWGSNTGLGTVRTSTQYTQSNVGQPITAGDTFGASLDAEESVTQGGTLAPNAYAIAIGVPGGDVGGRADAGWVAVLAPVDNAIVTRAVDQGSTAAAGNRFGTSVALGHLTGSAAVIDLAVGAPRDDLRGAADAGSVTVLSDVYGPPGRVLLTQNSPGWPDTAEAGDQLGRSLAALRVGATTRLAIGVPAEDLPKAKDAGAVQLVGPALKPGVLLTQDFTGVADQAEAGDAFGDRLAWAAPGGGEPFRLAVSAPLENLGAVKDAGMVQVFPVVQPGQEKTYTQDSPGVPGSVSAGDRLGRALAFVDGATERVLLVGVPDDVQLPTGAVVVLPAANGTPRIWRPGQAAVPTAGAVRFGAAVG